MRGNELLAISGVVYVERMFPIPMRGNERVPADTVRGVFIPFPIPMRGNEAHQALLTPEERQAF